eukprot:3608893-Amphidinium_carterae.1
MKEQSAIVKDTLPKLDSVRSFQKTGHLQKTEYVGSAAVLLEGRQRRKGPRRSWLVRSAAAQAENARCCRQESHLLFSVTTGDKQTGLQTTHAKHCLTPNLFCARALSGIGVDPLLWAWK